MKAVEGEGEAKKYGRSTILGRKRFEINFYEQKKDFTLNKNTHLLVELGGLIITPKKDNLMIYINGCKRRTTITSTVGKINNKSLKTIITTNLEHNNRALLPKND